MADKKPKQLDFFEELQKRKANKRKARAKKAVQKSKALPAPKKGTAVAKTTGKEVDRRGRAIQPKTHTGEYIPKEKPVGEAKPKTGRTIEGKQADKKLGGSKQKALPAPKGSNAGKFLRLLKLGGKAVPYVGTAMMVADLANEAKNAVRDDVDRRGRKKKEEPKKKEAPKAAAPAKKEEPKKEQKKTSAGSFKEAFAAARKSYQNGKGGTTFTWNGKKYSVATKDDVKKAGKKDLREYLNAGLKPDQKKK